ncbi:MAG: WbqC family protein [Deltaproteobacteria bacterium]|nr:WbqC family protein [Deltaproteobacteria bacterium]
MILGCIQPSYIPWKGYFHLIQKSDIFVFHDNIQYDKQSWRNRNLIKTAVGKQWLSVPVKIKDDWQKNILEVDIDNDQPWQRKHINLIRQNYLKSPFYDHYIDFFEDVYRSHWKRLVDLDVYLIKEICGFLGIRTRLISASELSLEGKKTDRLVQMCLQCQAKKYLSGPAAKEYIELPKFLEHGIELEYMDYTYPVYPQLFGEFDHQVSIIDVLFNCGENSYQYIWG